MSCYHGKIAACVEQHHGVHPGVWTKGKHGLKLAIIVLRQADKPIITNSPPRWL